MTNGSSFLPVSNGHGPGGYREITQRGGCREPRRKIIARKKLGGVPRAGGPPAPGGGGQILRLTSATVPGGHLPILLWPGRSPVVSSRVRLHEPASNAFERTLKNVSYFLVTETRLVQRSSNGRARGVVGGVGGGRREGLSSAAKSRRGPGNAINCVFQFRPQIDQPSDRGEEIDLCWPSQEVHRRTTRRATRRAVRGSEEYRAGSKTPGAYALAERAERR